MNQRAEERHESAIAGSLAGESDVVANGCQECPFATGRVELWKTDVVVADTAAAQATADTAPTTAIDATGQYRATAEPGPYLLCIRPGCVGLEVNAQQVTTINASMGERLTIFYVFNPGVMERSAPTVLQVH